ASRRTCCRAARCSRRCSARRWRLPKRRSGLSRLKHYLPGQRLRVAALAVCGVAMAGAPVAALLIVRDAINEAMLQHDKSRLGRDVVAYLLLLALASAPQAHVR